MLQNVFSKTPKNPNKNEHSLILSINCQTVFTKF